jgi:hypothetical protein
MSTSDERGRLAESARLEREEQIDLAKILKEKGYSNISIAHIMRVNESDVRTLLEAPKQINWGYNCLTQGIHHGRPEAIWNLPLLQASQMFTVEQLKELVVDRIYNDAMQFVNQDQKFIEEGARESVSYSKEWADKVKEIADSHFLTRYQNTLGAVTDYYRSPEFKRDLDGVIERNKQNKLNPGYQPLYIHDTINLLCRMIGTSSSIKASK